jgi:osmotically-inducible protein OsmY
MDKDKEKLKSITVETQGYELILSGIVTRLTFDYSLFSKID